MNVKKSAINVALGALLLVGMTGCDNSAPKCSDQDTQDLVISIAHDELVEPRGEDFANKIKLSLDGIRTTDFNEKTGAQECAAELVMATPEKSMSADITYTSENTDDGNFYVKVFGL